jgi:DnaK suppressor protein
MKRRDLIVKLSQTLHRRRAALCRSLSEQSEGVALAQRPVGDDVDAAMTAEQVELDLQLAAVESRELVAIEAALERIQEGRYGICDLCDHPISAVRLQALPYVNLCVKCQNRNESMAAGRTPVGHWKRLPDTSDEQDESERDVVAWEFV